MKLGITTIQRDRALFIKEWIAFHYLVGFRKFYIFMHNYTDNTHQILTNLKKQFDIEILTVSDESAIPQQKCYQYSCENFLPEVDWMAFIDGDEFLFPTHSEMLDTTLAQFTDKKLSALGVYWSVFGSGGHIEEPKGLIIENYKRRAPDNYINNRHIKSIVRGSNSELVKVGNDAHLFKTPLGTYDENLRPITSGLTGYDATYKNFRINHYICQSRSHFLNFKKHYGNFDAGSETRDESWWEEHNRNDVLDHSMDKFIKPLKDFLSSV